MGSNMQRQAVPLLVPEAPLVGTGIENKAAYDSGVLLMANRPGVVVHTTADAVIVRADDGTLDRYHLDKFVRSNQGTCINQRPIVTKGERVEAGTILADGPTEHGEMALGRNVLVALCLGKATTMKTLF